MDNPDGTSALHIITYPFCYNPLTNDVRFYRDYSFDISYTVSPVPLASLTNDKDAYQQGDTVVVDIRLNNSGEVQDVVVSTLIKRYGLDDVLPAVTLHCPDELSPTATTVPSDSSSTVCSRGTHRL